MSLQRIGWSIAFACAASQVWAVEKCILPDGKVVFQDQPCAGRGERVDVRPASGMAVKAAVPQGAASHPLTEAQRIEGLIASSQRDRRKTDLRDRLLPDAERTKAKLKESCAQRQLELEASQYAYKQNLYGKMHASQIASEMAANASLCDTKDRELKDIIETLAKECSSLQCR